MSQHSLLFLPLALGVPGFLSPISMEPLWERPMWQIQRVSLMNQETWILIPALLDLYSLTLGKSSFSELQWHIDSVILETDKTKFFSLSVSFLQLGSLSIWPPSLVLAM